MTIQTARQTARPVAGNQNATKSGDNAKATKPSDPTTASLKTSPNRFTTFDGTQLLYRVWQHDSKSPTSLSSKAVIILHRGHEHSQRYAEFAQSLVDEETVVFAWDARGHGLSPGKRGDAETFGDFARDLDYFVKHVAKETALHTQDIVIVGHSVGAVTLATWVHDYAPNIRGMILATPAFDVRLYMPFAKPALRAYGQVAPKSTIKSYVQPRMLTNDKAEAEKYQDDDLISPEISVRLLVDMADTANRVIEDAATISTPTLLIQADKDLVVNDKAQSKFFDRLSSPIKECLVLGGQRHGVFHELGRHETFAAVKTFIDKLYRQKSTTPDLTNAHQSGVTYDEHKKLSEALPIYCPRRWGFALQRLTLNTVGRLSRGVQIGLATGFDSGVSLDHVYENDPRGTTVIGRVLDRVYLNSIGWKGIRQRRVHLQQQLADAITTVAAKRCESPHQEDEDAVRILDVATGELRRSRLTRLSPAQSRQGATDSQRMGAGSSRVSPTRRLRCGKLRRIRRHVRHCDRFWAV